jgi:hypothetical protein
MHSIPTKYKGIMFRSRLEAKWACFLDLLGIPWLYEWTDLPGYIPDFLINHSLLAEVKGVATVAKLQSHVAKIEQAGWSGPWVLLGCDYTIQLGQRIKVPATAAALWAEACNTVKWLPATAKPVDYARQTPSFQAEQFQRDTQPVVAASLTQGPSLPELVDYRLPETPRTEPTPPRLPT